MKVNSITLWWQFYELHVHVRGVPNELEIFCIVPTACTQSRSERDLMFLESPNRSAEISQ